MTTDEQPRERTAIEMQDYLDEHNLTLTWLAAEHEENKEGMWETWAEQRRAAVLTGEAQAAYIAEHLELCHCGQTREWHNTFARDHQFAPAE